MDDARLGGRGSRVDLFLVSACLLFLELALVRWISTEVRVFAYFNNLVLLACFLGIGIGCQQARAPVRMAWGLGALAALWALVAAPLEVTIDGERLHLVKDTPTLLSAFVDSVVWYEQPSRHVARDVALGLAGTGAVFLLVLVAFVPLAQVLGRLMSGARDLVAAYTVNVAASLAGLWCMSLLSFAGQPPWAWFLVALLGVALLVRRQALAGTAVNALLVVCLAAAGALAVAPGARGERVLWSPYQKLGVRPLDESGPERGWLVTVNDVQYMTLLDLSPEFVAAHPDLFAPSQGRLATHDIPFHLVPRPADVLVIGAGGGNDVAAALRHGAGRVTAVEVDPGIIELGRALHPEQPYDDARTTVVVDDARAFLERDDGAYDVIAFGLLDAHATASSLVNLRLDHYVYTLESFARARALLQDDGVLTVVFAASREWLVDRIAGLLAETFGHEPLAFWAQNPEPTRGWGGVMLAIGPDMDVLHRAVAADPALAGYVLGQPFRPRRPVEPTTDDWPYLYLETRSIPSLHLAVSGLLVALLVFLRRVVVPRGHAIRWHFFFLGAAFLLLEFLNVSRTTLLFGSTWMVNAFTITGILVWILLANLTAARAGALDIRVVYGCLLASLVALYALPPAALDGLPLVARIAAASLVLNLPIYFAGLVFIDSFRTTGAAAHAALGANVLGAAVGGLCESASFVVGVRGLLVLVAGFYLASLATRERR